MAGIKYHSVTVKPTITASLQHGGVFTSGDVVFDWTEIQVPRGASKLVSLTAKCRDYTAGKMTDWAGVFYFSNSNSVSLGTINSAVSQNASLANSFLGLQSFTANDWDENTAFSIDYFSSLHKTPNIVMTPNSGDSIYIGCESMQSNEPALNHTTVRATATNAGAAGTQAQLEIDGGVDIQNVFAPEDVLVAHGDVVIGTVETVSSSTVFNLKGTNTGIIADDDYIYMQSPITLILGFEYV
jgi:hypothetical protein